MLGYRMIFEAPGRDHDLEKVAMSQLTSWLRHKRRLDADGLLPGREVPLGPGATGFLQLLESREGARSTRVRIVEDLDSCRWTTTLTIHVASDQRSAPWVWLDVDSSTGQRPGLPRLARDLLAVLGGSTPATSFSEKPEIVTGADVDRVIAHLLDDSRRRMAFVAGSDAQLPMSAWQTLLSQILNETVGLASAFVLNAEATAALAERLGGTHAVAAGTLRTFVDGVVPGDGGDALRHRILSTQRILRGDTRAVAQMLGARSRAVALEVPLPRNVLRVDRLLERQIDELVVREATASSEVPAPSVSPEPRQVLVPAGVPTGVAPDAAPDEASHSSTQQELARILSLVLGKAQPTDGAAERLVELAQRGVFGAQRHDALAARLTYLQDQLDAAHDEVDQLKRRLEDEQIESAQLFSEKEETERLTRHLRGLLAASSASHEAWLPLTAEPDGPRTFDDILTRVDQLPHVVITMRRPHCALELDHHDPLGTWAAKTWQVLQALNDYATCKVDGSWSKDVHGYLQATPPGRCGWSDRRHAQDESEPVKTNAAHRRERVLAVPVSVRADGEVFMGAHFKIAQAGLISPRLHYFDATGIDGKVYVGYIGRHLTTKKTN